MYAKQYDMRLGDHLLLRLIKLLLLCWLAREEAIAQAERLKNLTPENRQSRTYEWLHTQVREHLWKVVNC